MTQRYSRDNYSRRDDGYGYSGAVSSSTSSYARSDYGRGSQGYGSDMRNGAYGVSATAQSSRAYGSQTGYQGRSGSTVRQEQSRGGNGRGGAEVRGNVSRASSTRGAQEGYQNAQRYAGNNGYVSASREGRSSNRTSAIVAIIALVIVGIGIFTYINTRPKSITVDGAASQEVAFDTTYQALLDDGDFANATNGDLIAVDNSIITAGAGNAFTIYSNGDAVTDLKSRVKKGDVITSARGTDVMEQYTETQETVPWTFDIEGGTDYNFYAGSLTLAVTLGTDGVNLTRTGLTSGITAVSDQSTPMVPRKVITESYTPTDGSKVVALTFDDGPWPDSTEQVIAVLQQYGVTGTFFEIGSQIDEYPEISKAVADAGFQVASHGYYHGGGGNDYMNEMTADELQADLVHSYQVIESTTGETADQIVVRPSGGNFDYQALLNANNLVNYYIGWDVDTEDWSKPGVDTIVSNCLSNVFPGAVILMHDGGGDRTETIAALPTIIENLQSQGYTFVTVNELIQLELTQYAQREASSSSSAVSGSAA